MNKFCSECGVAFPPDSDARRKTCGTACRSRRSRRLKTARREATKLPPELKELADRSAGAVKDIGSKVIREQVGPVVREAMTNEVVISLREMVGLSIAAIKVLEEDLQSDNARLRQKAAELILRYSVGNEQFRPEPEHAQRDIQINFALPRPEAPEEITAEADVVEDEPTTDTRQCDMCQGYKPDSQFVEGSERCRECFDEQQAMAERLLNQ